MARISALAVYCGSNPGNDPIYRELAIALGRALATRGVTLVYGGGRVGLMGALADAAVAAGGQTIGVIPEHLATHELRHTGLSQSIVVKTMHERKQRMFDLVDAFAVLPGGLGTFDEAIEVITWRQLRLHDKPILLVDPNGYWQRFRDLIDHAIGHGFASHAALRLFGTVASVEALFDALAAAPEPRLREAPERL